MQRAFAILAFMMLLAATSASVQAACGGGGYKPAAPTVRHEAQNVSYSTSSSSSDSRLEGLQRDIDKAQAKLDRCTGNCDKERRKLEEAKAKYARKASEVKIDSDSR